MVVDEVELVRPLEDLRDVQPPPDLGVEGTILFVAGGADAVQVGARQGVGGGEQRDVYSRLTNPSVSRDTTCSQGPW